MKRADGTAQARPRPATDPLAGSIAASLESRLDGVPPTRIVRRASPYRSTLPLYEVDVTLEDGTRMELVLKRLGRAADGRALRSRPAFLRASEREAGIYRDVLSRFPLGAPRFHGTWGDGRAGAWLLLERVPGVPLWQAVDDGAWARVAAWLGRFHARYAPLADSLARAGVRVLDDDYLARWARRAGRVQHGGRVRRLAAVLDRVARLRPSLSDRLLAYPRTFVHGEFYPANILVGSLPEGRVSPVDWEMAAVGPGLLDLAALATGLGRADQARLIDAYHGGWTGHGGTRSLTRTRIHDGLLVGGLQLAIQWLGWSREWTPPPEQARDWLAQAESMLEELGS